ncbi:hypothetical protein [Haemophilus parahaemolyticus]|uniref:DUF6414 family protein n=1 Tax=Haemophilus parahaemolyticus TaxID=735 RepID=UPI0028ED18C5|nr:hypothetical protein [Haemophilus parahaemolyticus]
MSNEQVQDLPTIDFLTDFLYVDEKRAKQFLAQLVTEGVLSSYKEEIGNADSSTGELGFSSIITGKKTGNIQNSERYVREYDASHSLPSLLLDFLGQNGFIKNSIDNAQVGNLVLISGEYRLFDLSLIEKAMPFLNAVENENPLPDGIDKLFNLFPKSLQVDIRDDRGNFYWLALKKEDMWINVDDVLLSNGITNRDKWFVLGILENLPDAKAKKGHHPYKFQDEKTDVLSIYDHIQELIGRKGSSYAVTPLLIFRKIGK